MARQARSEVIDPRQIQIVHCYGSCVRSAFLCGSDPVTGKSFEHRRDWIRQRLEFLASIYAIDCITYSVMSNHFHSVLRSRPDIVDLWNDKEVARRWLNLCPPRRHKDGSPCKPRKCEIRMLVRDKERIDELRQRLSDISWFMKFTREEIACRSNREDEITGHFWDGRFKSQILLDEASLVACVAYVDLNPVRAAMAETPEQSLYTGVKDRIDDLIAQHPDQTDIDTHAWERDGNGPRSRWLSPIEIDEANDPIGPDPSRTGRRASQKGALPISLTDYLKLIDWSGRQLREGKRGKIPEHLAPILTRLGLSESAWWELISDFESIFKRVAGTPANLKEEALRRGQKWLQAPGNPLGSAA